MISGQHAAPVSTCTFQGCVLVPEGARADICKMSVMVSLDTACCVKARADMRAVARYFEFYGGAADKVHGETIPYQDGYSDQDLVHRFPLARMRGVATLSDSGVRTSLRAPHVPLHSG